MPVSEKEPDTEDLRPASVVALLRDVGPVGIKLGQPRDQKRSVYTTLISAFGTLHDQVEPLPFDKIEPVIVSAWAATGNVNSPLSREPDRPLYRTDLCRKPLDGRDYREVRRPGMASRIEADMRLLTRLAGLAERRSSDIAHRPVEFLQTFAKNLAGDGPAAEARACERIGGYLEMLGVRRPRSIGNSQQRRSIVQKPWSESPRRGTRNRSGRECPVREALCRWCCG